MTREEAKQVFLSRGYIEVEGGTIYDADKWRESCRVISEWLEQEPSGDVVSRQAVLNLVVANHTELNGVNVVMYSPFYKDITQLPSVNPQEKMGHWIRWYEQKETERYIENIPHCKCSECGKEYDPHSSQFIKFCSNCGARMLEPICDTCEYNTAAFNPCNACKDKSEYKPLERRTGCQR